MDVGGWFHAALASDAENTVHHEMSKKKLVQSPRGEYDLHISASPTCTNNHPGLCRYFKKQLGSCNTADCTSSRNNIAWAICFRRNLREVLTVPNDNIGGEN